jgi:hypothetical protein
MHAICKAHLIPLELAPAFLSGIMLYCLAYVISSYTDCRENQLSIITTILVKFLAYIQIQRSLFNVSLPSVITHVSHPQLTAFS